MEGIVRHHLNTMQRREVGYVLLEDCEVILIEEENNNDNPRADEQPQLGVWQSVELQSPSSLHDDSNADLPSDLVHRELILRVEKNNTTTLRAAYAISPFNGVLSEITAMTQNNHSSSSEAGQENSVKRRRSDASLLAGLALEINNQSLAKQPYNNEIIADEIRTSDDFRFLQMETAQIIFQANNDMKSEFDNEKIMGTNCTHRRIRASFLITFSFPIHVNTGNDTGNESMILNSKQQRNNGGKKVLSTAFQLIGSIIRCDWGNLDARMKELECSNRVDSRSATTTTKPFFPLELTVENLYDRISGASQHFGSDYEPKHQQVNSTNVLSCGILGIPEEIVRTSIAPYLKARSLHSLRLTNRRMYTRLQAVVPGLKLKLFHHQIRSLEWMEIRERRCITEEDLLRSNNTSRIGAMLHDGESVCGGDYHRSVTGGASVKLCTRRSNSLSNEMTKAYRFDALSGSSINTSQFTYNEHSEWLPSHLRSTKAARGGLLCDEPGLGKTVTVLSLILRSLGLSVDVLDGSSTIDDEAIFHSYWESEYLTIHVRRPAILKLVTRLLKSDNESGYFIPPIGTFDCPDYFDIIEQGNEICFQDIRNYANKGDCKDFKAFEANVYQVFENAMAYNPPDSDVHRAALRMVDNAKVILATFKSDQVNTAMKSLSRIRQSESYSLINMLEAKKRAELQDPLVASSSTLLVVPNPLLNHWEEQIISHINFQYCSKHCHAIYYHTKKRNMKASSPAISFDLESVLKQGPFVFIDDGTKALPPASTLARFCIVLTAYNRFTAEWKQGSLENELRASRKGCIHWGDDLDSEEASPLLKVHWVSESMIET